MPSPLLRATKDLYEDDTYELVDGKRCTGPINPTRGVKQGRPPSPTIFSLFVNDVPQCFPNEQGGLN